MNNSIQYLGDVKLALDINGKLYEFKTHNNGLPSLFKGLCKALCGYQVNDLIPKYLDLRNSATADFTYSSSALTSLSTFTSPVYEQDDELNTWVAKFITSIYSEQLNVDLDTTTDYFRLYLKSDTDFCAYIDVDLETLQTITSNIALQITWKLYFVNQTVVS